MEIKGGMGGFRRGFEGGNEVIVYRVGMVTNTTKAKRAGCGGDSWREGWR